MAKNTEEGLVAAAPTLPENEVEDNNDHEESDEELYEEEAVVIKKDLEEGLTIQGDLNLDFELLKRIPCLYTDIIAEFADVEIFMISIDSMLLEFTAHNYHNWVLGGQTIVLAEQINSFLNALSELNAKFILVWFSDLTPLYEKDQFLHFIYSFVIAYLSNSKWAEEMECFSNPLDQEWNDFLHRLTPSFLLASMENPSRTFVQESIDFASCFLSVAIQLINTAIPVVLFNGFTINFSSVMAYRLSTIPLSIINLEEKIANLWPDHCGAQQLIGDDSPIYSCLSVSQYWAFIIAKEIQSANVDTDFEEFCNAVLISSLVCGKLGANRYYCDDPKSTKGPPPAANKNRRRLFSSSIRMLSTVDLKKLKFPLSDLWDGRMILAIYKKIVAKIEVLPFRFQEEFAKLHEAAKLKTAVPTDVNDKLLDPLTPSSEMNEKSYIKEVQLFSVKNQLIDDFIPEAKELLDNNGCVLESKDQTKFAQQQLAKWRFAPIPDKLLQFEKTAAEKPTEAWRIRRVNRDRQKLSRWYQNFADSLEGRGNDLLVDFSRTPRLPAVDENDDTKANGVGKKGTAKNVKKGSKPGKEPQLSKKDQILKANRDNLNKKQIESDKTKIAFATHVKAQAITALEDVFRKLELNESKALCIYEKIMRYSEMFADKILTFKSLDEKRDGALDLVDALKTCSTKFFDYLNPQQKEKIRFLWASLGFVKDSKRSDKSYDLGMNIVDYQLYHGGRLIEIQSDPKKDDRVVGFLPDGWQRKMLDVVDKNKSALIIAPTSAGKTFVSYYCIEKVLRQSNDDVVVYISPAKALMNQVVGSVYARFRNKPMAGGKVLYGTFTLEYTDNCMNCQVLVTIPECLEIMLLSSDPHVQEFVSRIKYVILDEVHCINALNQGHIWEHIFLLIRCPFLALSATISNVEDVQKWLQHAEDIKALAGSEPREVEMITYDERWSELELAIAKMQECTKDVDYTRDVEIFNRGGSVQSVAQKSEDDLQSNGDEASRATTPSVACVEKSSKMALMNELIMFFHPYGIYKPEKLRMFGIPTDQRLTARQVVELYSIMSEVDAKVKAEFEPSHFFGAKKGDEDFIWLTRKTLRDYENKLKNCFLDWLNNDQQKTTKVFSMLDANVAEEFEKRSKPFNMKTAALHNIAPLMDELKATDRLPALCFSDDRDICEYLAVRLFTEMQNREFKYRSTDDFKRRFNSKAEDKAAKLAKRRRDAPKKKKKKKGGGDSDEESGKEGDWGDDGGFEDAASQFIMQKIKLEEELKRFKFYGRWTDEDVYNKTIERLVDRSGNRPSTQRLIRLFARGIGFHHDGMTAPERGAVEILFRAGFLGIVFSTSTLALGMNMPCKTVVFGIDTPMLTPLQFRQMSGRAGRRGFDSSGTVIFMALPTSKIRRLLTSSLATLRGNVPFTTSFLLKLFAYVKGSKKSLLSIEPTSTTGEEHTAQSQTPAKVDKVVFKKKHAGAVDTTDVTNADIRRLAALSLLRSPFVLHTRHHTRLDALERILKFLTFFNVQLLRKHNFLNEKCEVTEFAFFAEHLSNFEPGNLVFTVVVQSGILHHLIKEFDDDDKASAKELLLNVVAHIFTNKFLPIYSYNEFATAEVGVSGAALDVCEKQEPLIASITATAPIESSVVDEPVLKPMPLVVEEIINDYNEGVEKLLLACLQLASPNQRIQNSVIQLTGKCEEINLANMNIVPTLDHDFLLDDAFIPTIRLQSKDHRNRKIYRNSYAMDFWKRSDSQNLIDYNKLSISEIWYLINDFNKVLAAINVAFSSMAKSTDPVGVLFAEIASEYEYKFKRAFGMIKKQEDRE